MSPPLRRFALFGPRAAGKTVFLTVLYGTSQHRPDAEDGYLITAADDPADPTHKTLKDWWLTLMNGVWLPPSAFENLKLLRFSFTTGAVRYDVELPDVAGEVTRRLDSVEDDEALEGQLKKQILAEYQDFHGYVLFVSGQSSDQVRAQEFKWEVDALLNALKERTQDGGMISRPVAILITKWDLHSPTPASDEEEAAKAEHFFEKDHSKLLHALRATCKNLRVFPISATGPLDQGQPPQPVEPYNLATPIKWLLETSDRVWLERAQSYWNENRNRLFERLPSDSTRSHWEMTLERFEEAKQNLPVGLHAVAADKAIKLLHQLRSRRRLKFAAGGVVTALLLTIVVWGFFDWHHLATARRLLPVEAEDPKQAVVSLSQVNHAATDSWQHWVGCSLGWQRTLRNEMNAVAKRHADAVFHEMSSLDRDDLDEGPATEQLRLATLWRDLARYTTPTDEQPLIVTRLENVAKRCRFECGAKLGFDDLQQRATPILDLAKTKPGSINQELLNDLQGRIKTFLAEFGASDDFGASKFVAEVSALQAKLDAIKVDVDEQRAWDQLEKQLAQNADKPLRCYEFCRAFLAEHGQGRKATDARKRADGYFANADDEVWRDIRSFRERYRTDFRGVISKCDGYLKTDFKLHRDEAKRQRKETLVDWDKTLFERLTKRVADGNDAATIQSVRDLCREYLAPQETPKTMQHEVSRWLKWHDGLIAGQTLTVRVESVEVKRGSRWHSKFYDPDVKVTVRLSGRSRETDEKEVTIDREERAIPGNVLGPFVWKWGEPDVHVKITCTDYNLPDPLPFDPPNDDPFKAKWLNRTVPFDSGKILVRLKCSEVEPPPLSSYKNQ